MEEQNKNEKLSKFVIIGAIIFALLTLVIIVAIGYLMYLSNTLKNTVQNEVQEKYYDNTNVVEDVQDTVTNNANVTQITKNDDRVDVDVDVDNVQEVHDVVVEKTFVDWLDELQEAPDEVCVENADCYLVGKIIKGDKKLIGQNMYIESTPTMGGYEFKHFAFYEENGNKYKFIFTEKNSPIAGIDDVPTKLTIDGINAVFNGSKWVNYFFDDVEGVEDHKIAKHDTLGKIYRVQKDCLLARLPDHTAKAYDYEIPFVDDTRKPSITFDDGTKNEYVYEYNFHTCDALCVRYVHNEEISKDDLVKVGEASNGDAIYALKDPHNSILEELYNNKNTVAYFGDDWSDKLDHNKYSYDEYISMHPYLYWEDPFGGLVQFTNEKFVLAAEMCKPVVYFYPEKEENIFFDVSPIGGFTHTEPRYVEGWDLKMIGDGKIIDNRTGKKYDSLLWEGMALNYTVSDKGWVVAKEELGIFFDDKLSELGMNKREIYDFKEYWIERLDKKPYYRISFMDRKQFDKLAPLSFSKKPDNIIRIMMIAKGENQYYQLQEPNLTNNIDRDGFTVVEWGGMLEQ